MFIKNYQIDSSGNYLKLNIFEYQTLTTNTPHIHTHTHTRIVVKPNLPLFSKSKITSLNNLKINLTVKTFNNLNFVTVLYNTNENTNGIEKSMQCIFKESTDFCELPLRKYFFLYLYE